MPVGTIVIAAGTASNNKSKGNRPTTLSKTRAKLPLRLFRAALTIKRQHEKHCDAPTSTPVGWQKLVKSFFFFFFFHRSCVFEVEVWPAEIEVCY